MDQPTRQRWTRGEWLHGAAWGAFTASMGAMVIFGADRLGACCAMGAALLVAVVTQPDRHPADGPAQPDALPREVPTNRRRAGR